MLRGDETSEVSVVGPGTRIEGTVVAAGSLRVEGEVKGKITAEREVTLSPQGRVEATIHERQEDGGWATRRLSRASDRLTFGEIGEVCALGDLYRHTNLDPAHGRNLA